MPNETTNSARPADSHAPARPNFPQMEEEIAAFWDKNEIFKRSVEERPENKTFVFYDGPPFATGLPHHGHLLQSTLKDVVPRYATMQGYRVPRVWGWDCHGLPIENLVEKGLNLNSRRDIEGFGIDKFNAACRDQVLTYAKEWQHYIHRFGRWVDMEHAYKTMDTDYIESVWWGFAELYKKALVYKSQRVSYYCPRCATTLANIEVTMGNSYEDHEDPAITVKFKVVSEEKTYLLAWTTTPWTLPANVAIVAHPELIYVKVKIHETGETYLFAEARMNDVLKQHYPLVSEAEVPFEVMERKKGSELVGLHYEPLYTFIAPDKDAYRVVAMEYVTADDGTGLVHTAPAFGEDDFLAAKAHNLPVLLTVDEEGKQMREMGQFAGMPIKQSDELIIADLMSRGLIYRQERTVHSVAVCWRCNTPLLYRAQPAWFVNIAKLKPKLLETAKKINWHPEHFKEGRFGKGLESSPDWCISRTRYWGAPMPVWVCDACERMKVVGSLAELRELAGKEAVPSKFDPHRPEIDGIAWNCACGGSMKRVPEVFDCWFESGSMPFASQHYPFENKQRFEENYPADFIAEAQDQTRGWFYSLHVLSTALFGKPAFKDVVVTGLVMAEDGKKMSKKLRNYTDPYEIMTRYGADALRYYLVSSPVVRAEQLNFSEKDCEAIQRALFGTLWNVRAFFLTYVGSERMERVKPRSSHVLDRWIFARLMSLEKEMTEAMERYDLMEAARLVRPFVDDLSTWWLRRSRERMKGDDAYDRTDALRTLWEALIDVSLLIAPFTPFFAERLYQDLEGPKMSVHLDRWPKADERLIDEQLLADMNWVREVVTAGLEARVQAKIPVRQVLSSLAIRFRDAALGARLAQRAELLNLIRDELNVERVIVLGGANDVPESLVWAVALDTALTPELKKKGMLRQLVRHLMNLRKNALLQPSDAITAYVGTQDPGLRDLLEGMKQVLAQEINATDVVVAEGVSADLPHTALAALDAADVTIGLKKA